MNPMENNRYHYFRVSYDPKDTGIRSGGAQAWVNEKRFPDPLTYQKIATFFSGNDNWSKNNYFPSFPVGLDYLELASKSGKLTDFMSFYPNLTYCPFLISNKAAEILSRFNIALHRLYPAKVYNKAGQFMSDYYLFCVPFIGHEAVDFPKSLFSATVLSTTEYVSCQSAKEYLAGYEYTTQYSPQKKIALLEVEKIMLKHDFDTSLDMFNLMLGGVFVSTELKLAIEKAGLKAVTFPKKRILEVGV
jgi:hypothetical protein